ncbi:MAG: signal transduction histidine kinase, partial [Myxococcota bacterium]
RQMDRMRKLNAFTLSTSRARSPKAVVQAWVALIRDVYPVPMVVGVAFDDGKAEVVVHRDGTEQQEFQVDAWLHFYDVHELPSCQAVHIKPGADICRLLEIIDGLDSPEDKRPRREAEVNVVLTVRGQAGTPRGLLVATLPSELGREVLEAQPRRNDEPFLQTVRGNVEVALDAVRMYRQLHEARQDLEERVDVRTQELTRVNDRLEDSLEKLRATQSELIEASRLAGMSEVATGVLHNVGNVLNSVNVSAWMVSGKAEGMLDGRLEALAILLANEQMDLSEPHRRRQVAEYVRKLARRLNADRSAVIDEAKQLSKNIDHIRRIVSTQQSFARAAGVSEICTVQELVDDALTLNAGLIAQNSVELTCEVDDLPGLSIDRHKVLQILVNLISNAVQAVVAARGDGRHLWIRCHADGTFLSLRVRDNGVGIPAANLSRVFAQGFTTRADGHGFGLHTSACAAQELGGVLTCSSEGSGHGATFLLQLPRSLEIAV